MKSFADLKGLGKQLKEQEEQRALADRERAKQQKAAAAAATVFQSSMSGVQKMKPSDRYVPPPAKGPAAANRPAPAGKRGPLTAAEQAADDAAVLRESLSDLFEVDHYMEEDPALNYTAPGVGPDVMKKMRKGQWPVQDELDLHGMRRDEARQAVSDFLLKASRRNFRCVCVIYGRGYGSPKGEPVLKSMVHSWLVQTDGVIAFCQARAEEGGEGALMVLLRSALADRR
ncbi:Smr/MutS family protein [Pseudoduganella violaceinigra]|uniref:Smr/MutS family protein n=1 Tax=Pseudoduganella violaceinigra TaxID=246602 RepID=UPI000417C772|nr:Smr/MutS family protein [Pseudoduganella violaceinigra]